MQGRLGQNYGPGELSPLGALQQFSPLQLTTPVPQDSQELWSGYLIISSPGLFLVTPLFPFSSLLAFQQLGRSGRAVQFLALDLTLPEEANLVPSCILLQGAALPQDVPRRLGTLGSDRGTLRFCPSLGVSRSRGKLGESLLLEGLSTRFSTPPGSSGPG